MASNAFGGRRHLGIRQREALTFYLFTAPALLGFLAFQAFPIASSLFLSLTDYDIVRVPHFTALANYQDLWGDPLFTVALFNTNYLVFYAVPLSLAFSFALALALNQRLRGMAVYRTLFYLPAIVPTVATASLWLYLLQPQWGLVNGLLRFLGLPAPGWLTSEVWSKPALILLMLWSSSNMVLIFLAGLQSVPPELHEAAIIDGGSAWERLMHITLPLVAPTIFFTLVISIIGTFNAFSIVYVVTDGMGGPLNSTLVYMLYLYRHAFVFFRMGYASAMAWILFLIILALTLIQFRTARLWVYYEVER